METAQKLMPYFQELLQQWYQLTLHNQEYAIFLAVAVFLITAFFYSIRIGFLKSGAAKMLKAKQEIQASLDEAKQQLEALQQQLTEATEQKLAAEQSAQAESHRATAIELRLSKSNQQLATSLVNLVDCFELNLHNLPAADAENLLPEFDAVIARVADRFQTEQQAKTQLQLTMHAESAKLAEKEMLISSLESRLDAQTQQLAKLELAVEKYEAAQKQLEQDKLLLAQQQQQRNAEMQRQHSHESLAAPVTPAPVQTTVAQAPEPVKAEAIEKLAETQPAIPDAKPGPAPVTPQPQPVVSQPAKAAAEKKTKPAAAAKTGLFGRIMEKVAKMDQKLGSPGTVNLTPEPGNVTEPPLEKPYAAEQSETVEPAVRAENSKRDSGVNDKLSGLFGGFKKSAAKPANAEVAPETAVHVAEEVQPEAAPPTAKDKKAATQLTGLFGKFKSKK